MRGLEWLRKSHWPGVAVGAPRPRFLPSGGLWRPGPTLLRRLLQTTRQRPPPCGQCCAPLFALRGSLRHSGSTQCRGPGPPLAMNPKAGSFCLLCVVCFCSPLSFTHSRDLRTISHKCTCLRHRAKSLWPRCRASRGPAEQSPKTGGPWTRVHSPSTPQPPLSVCRDDVCLDAAFGRVEAVAACAAVCPTENFQRVFIPILSR